MSEFTGLPTREAKDHRPRFLRYAEQQLRKGAELRIVHSVDRAIWRSQNRIGGDLATYEDAMKLLGFAREHVPELIARDDAAEAVIRAESTGRVELGGHVLPDAESAPARRGSSPQRKARPAPVKMEIVERVEILDSKAETTRQIELTRRCYSISELAQMTGCADQTVRNWCPSLTTEARPFVGKRTKLFIITDDVLARFLRAKGFAVITNLDNHPESEMTNSTTIADTPLPAPERIEPVILPPSIPVIDPLAVINAAGVKPTDFDEATFALEHYASDLQRQADSYRATAKRLRALRHSAFTKSES